MQIVEIVHRQYQQGELLLEQDINTFGREETFTFLSLYDTILEEGKTQQIKLILH